MTDQQKVEAYIDQQQQETFDLLARMVRQPSIQYHEAGAQQVVIDKLKQLELDVDVWDPDIEALKKNPYFVSTRKDFTNSPNVVGVLKGQGGGRSLILNGHIDVVPEGETTKWKDDPYSGKIEDGRMYGRGTTDMKGGNVAMILAIESIKRTGIQLKGDVIFQSVIEEESGGAGTLATVLRGYYADAAIIPEPTNLKLFIKQQGSLWFRVSIEGVIAHGGTRYEGVSAIEKAWIAHQKILDLEKERNARITDPMYEKLPIPLPINVGTIHGGTWPSSVPDLVTIEGRIGVGPDETIDAVKQELHECINQLSAADDWFSDHPAKLEFFGAQWLPNSVPVESQIAGIVEENFRQLFGDSIIVEASPWGTDAGILGTVGGIPAIVIGPGETSVAHYPNEYVELQKVVKVAKLFALTILKWCETT